jgi:hypothetical protein
MEQGKVEGDEEVAMKTEGATCHSEGKERSRSRKRW